MSETTQPGRLLDAQVAQIMGRLSDKVLAELKQRGIGAPEERDMYGRYVGSSPWENVSRYSTDPAAAMEAWAWLEENNPWKRPDTIAFALTRDDNGSPSVLHIYGYDEYSTIAIGSTYPHAISLAVCEAGKLLGVVDIG